MVFPELRVDCGTETFSFSDPLQALDSKIRINLFKRGCIHPATRMKLLQRWEVLANQKESRGNLLSYRLTPCVRDSRNTEL